MTATARHAVSVIALPLLALLALSASTGTASATPVTAASTSLVVHEEVVTVGTTVQGRSIVAVHRWTDGATHPLLLLGSMHGEEQAGMRVVRRLARVGLPAGVDLWLVSTMNPDGASGFRRDNAHGVDLNRNFPTYFQRSKKGTLLWSGPRPASEPETRTMMRLLTTVSPWTVLSLHQPLFAVDTYRMKSPALVRRLHRLTGLPMAPLDCNGGCHGTMTDWFNTHFPGRAVTMEFRRHAAQTEIARMTTAVLTIAAG